MLCPQIIMLTVTVMCQLTMILRLRTAAEILKLKVSHTQHQALARGWSQCIGSRTKGDFLSHPPRGRLPLLSARPVVTFPATEHYCPMASTKSYCLVKLKPHYTDKRTQQMDLGIYRVYCRVCSSQTLSLLCIKRLRRCPLGLWKNICCVSVVFICLFVSDVEYVTAKTSTTRSVGSLKAQSTFVVSVGFTCPSNVL